MKPKRWLSLYVLLLCLTSFEAQAQLFGKKKKKTEVSGFVLEEAQTPEDRQKALERQLVNPIRKFVNKFNFQIEKSYGYFSYQNPLTDVAVIRNARQDQLYIVPLGQESSGFSKLDAFSGWFNRFVEANVSRIDDDDQIVRTDTVDFVFRNSGRYNPIVLRANFSLKKLDKGHFERTGEKLYLDDDMLRVGVGIGFGALKFSNPSSSQEVDPLLRRYELSNTKIPTTKLFGTITYNFYTLGDFSMLLDVQGGVWKIKESLINTDIIIYDPFINVGVMFQTKFSKYFKGYIRAAFERRSYSLDNQILSVDHQFSIFNIDLGLLMKYPTYPRNSYAADQVQMEHVFNGKMYRGRPFYRKQNPRYGQRRNTRKPTGSSFPIIKDKKSKKGGETSN